MSVHPVKPVASITQQELQTDEWIVKAFVSGITNLDSIKNRDGDDALADGVDCKTVKECAKKINEFLNKIELFSQITPNDSDNWIAMTRSSYRTYLDKANQILDTLGQRSDARIKVKKHMQDICSSLGKLYSIFKNELMQNFLSGIWNIEEKIVMDCQSNQYFRHKLQDKMDLLRNLKMDAPERKEDFESRLVDAIISSKKEVIGSIVVEFSEAFSQGREDEILEELIKEIITIQKDIEDLPGEIYPKLTVHTRLLATLRSACSCCEEYTPARKYKPNAKIQNVRFYQELKERYETVLNEMRQFEESDHSISHLGALRAQLGDALSGGIGEMDSEKDAKVEPQDPVNNTEQAAPKESSKPQETETPNQPEAQPKIEATSLFGRVSAFFKKMSCGLVAMIYSIFDKIASLFRHKPA